MKLLFFFSLLLAVHFPTYANESINENPVTSSDLGKTETITKQTAVDWLNKLKVALSGSNFDAGIVKIRGNKTESFQWLHGYISGLGEVERISPLIGGGITTVRHNSVVTFFEANNQAYSVSSVSIRKFIPPVFYKDTKVIGDSYRLVLVSKSQFAGRSAQLLRIESKDNSTYNYWLWIDVESGLPLRMAYVTDAGDIIEQVLMTHLRLHAKPTEEINELANIQLPLPSSAELANRQQTNNWQMTWVPKGFELLKSDRHHVSISREVSDYYLYSDGLVELSIYVQRPLDSFESPVVLTDGATSFVMVRSSGFDVTVVGKIPPKIAHKIATSVKSNQL